MFVTGNFNTGELQIGTNGKVIINLHLSELNQNSPNFQKSLYKEITAAFNKTYDLGYLEAKNDVISKLNEKT